MVNYPNDWRLVEIEDIFTVTRGQVLSTEKIKVAKSSTYRYPVYSSQTLNNGLLGYYNDYLFKDAITWTTDGANAGDTNYRKGEFYCTNVCGVLLNNEGYANECIAAIINSISRKYVSYVGNPKLMNNVVKKIKICIPELKEQKAITETLMAFDKHIENLSKLIEKKKMIRDGAVEDLVSGKKRLQGFNTEWDRYKFKKYFSKIPNNTFARDELSVKGNIGSIHYGDILTEYNTILEDKDYITFLKSEEWYSERKSLKINDVIIADTAEDETVGRVVQVGEISCPIVSGLHTIACRPNYDTAYSFLGYYMNSKCFHNQILPYITGIKVSSISKKALDELELVIPTDMKEQKAIANILSSMDKEIENLEKEKEKYQQLKSGAMDDLLTGKIRLV